MAVYHVDPTQVWEVSMTEEFHNTMFAHVDSQRTLFFALQHGVFPANQLEQHVVRKHVLDPPARSKDDIYERLNPTFVSPVPTEYFLKLRGSPKWARLDTHADLVFH
jgi:hypothetical protein